MPKYEITEDTNGELFLNGPGNNWVSIGQDAVELLELAEKLMVFARERINAEPDEDMDGVIEIGGKRDT